MGARSQSMRSALDEPQDHSDTGDHQPRLQQPACARICIVALTAVTLTLTLAHLLLEVSSADMATYYKMLACRNSSETWTEGCPGIGPASMPTLVVYAWSASEKTSLGNLDLFVRQGMSGCPTCMFVITVEGNIDEGDLPKLPSNAKYLQDSSGCYVMGRYRWALENSGVSLDEFGFFVFLSSARGPFLPPYAQGEFHFTELWRDQITPEVKLVGPTISCVKVKDGGKEIQQPHLQSYAMGMDRIGLNVLLDEELVFACHTDRHDDIVKGELGASAAITAAGYNLGSFLIAYQGRDWRKEENKNCNEGKSPYDGLVEGTQLSPYELLFLKDGIHDREDQCFVKQVDAYTVRLAE